MKKGDWRWGYFKGAEQPGTPSPGRSTVERWSFSCLAGSDSVGGCVKDASRHMTGLKALVATRNGVGSTGARGYTLVARARTGSSGERGEPGRCAFFVLREHEESLELHTFTTSLAFRTCFKPETLQRLQ